MVKINRFEELEIWQLARVFAKEIYGLTNKSGIKEDYGLKNQIRRSVGSVMDNIAEGYERSGNKELLQYLYIAKGSCGEVRSQLYRASDLNYISKEEFESYYKKAIELNSKIGRLISYLKNSEYKGSKFRD